MKGHGDTDVLTKSQVTMKIVALFCPDELFGFVLKAKQSGTPVHARIRPIHGVRGGTSTVMPIHLNGEQSMEELSVRIQTKGSRELGTPVEIVALLFGEISYQNQQVLNPSQSGVHEVGRKKNSRQRRK